MKRLERKMIYYQIMGIHCHLVRSGRFNMARIILRFLRRGCITLSLNDDDWEVERILTKTGLRPIYDSQGNWTRFNLNKGAL